MTIGHTGKILARLAGATLAGAALLAGVGCAHYVERANCGIENAAVQVDGTAREYNLLLFCLPSGERVSVEAAYDPATKQAKERISHPEGKATATWQRCSDDPWIAAVATCERLSVSATSARYQSALQHAIDNMPSNRPYSSQQIDSGSRSRLQKLLADAPRPNAAPARPQVPVPADPVQLVRRATPTPAPFNQLSAVRFPTIEQGDTGEAVTSLQYLLREHGFDVYVDGDFGPQTAESVRAWQRREGRTVDGSISRTDWMKLVVELRFGSQGEAVRALQSQLASRGLEVVIDGDFGPQTEGAVREFQRTRGLTVNGIVSVDDWAALISGK